MKINLKELREKAQRRDENGKPKSITRDELALMLAETLGRTFHVTQIARYEEDSGSVPLEILAGWLRCLGSSIEEQVLSATVVPSEREFDPGDPYAKLRSRIALLHDYLLTASAEPELGKLPANLPNVDLAAEVVEKIGRKPNVVLSGAFDVGKSTLANWLMNTNSTLPTQYQPTTAVVTYVRHLDDKPDWLAEDVVLLKPGFDPDQWRNEEHVRMHRVISGNLETLRQYGTHGGDRFKGSGADTALVFLKSPILRACNLIDFPGYQNDDEDTARANRAIRHMNVLVYASASQGFMGAQDMERLRYLLKQLPDYERTTPGFPVLGNLFLIATHAGPQISDSQLFGGLVDKGLLNVATDRICLELEDIELAARSEETGMAIDGKLIRSRIFPFWRENVSRTESLANDLNELLSEHLPTVVYGEADRQIEEFKKGAEYRYRVAVESYEKVLSDIDSAKALYEQKLKEEPVRKRQVKAMRNYVIDRIDQIKQEHLEVFLEKYATIVEAQRIEEQIVKRYEGNKKEAQQFMAGFVVNELQAMSERFAKRRKDQISSMIEKYVNIYDMASGIDVSKEQYVVEIPFDSRGSFIGGLAGLGSIGALSLWASSLGNLGGYIITAKVVSLLSGIGIATGGTASAIGLLSAVGGPVTLAIGLAVALFFGFRALFGDSWQTRLARQIVEHFKKDKVQGKFEKAISEYWDSTKEAFERAADAVERDFVAELKNLGDVYKDPEKKADAVRMVGRYKKARDFFGAMPWISLRPGRVAISSIDGTTSSANKG